MSIHHPSPRPDGGHEPIKVPSEPTDLASWHAPERVARAVPEGRMPDSLNGVAFSNIAPGDEDFRRLARAVAFTEPDFNCPSWLAPATGVVIVEPDGRVWVDHPTNAYADYKCSFPKGRIEGGEPMRETAVREAWEEAGLLVEVFSYLCDSKRSQTYSRYYLARRVGGNPAQMGWESQAVSLVPVDGLKGQLNKKVDHMVVDALLARRAEWRTWFSVATDEEVEEVEQLLVEEHATASPDRGVALSSRAPLFVAEASAPFKSREPIALARYQGCLLGGAVGDALGAPVEFLSLEQIQQRFGPRGITEFAPAYGGLGKITDDTQMTLFTAEGLLRGWVRGVLKGITTYPGVVGHAYLRWLRTQGERNRHDLEFGLEEPGWLWSQKALHSRRGPGMTCLSALREMPSLGAPARNTSKGCGGVMRVAPVGLFAAHFGERPERTFDLGVEIAALTHGHPSGSLAAGAMAVMVHRLVEGASMLQAVQTSRECLQGRAGAEEVLRALDKAQALADSEKVAHRAVAALGEGWVAEEALAIGVYCALAARNFEQGVFWAVNHGGDSDSTGAIAGNLLGALHGVDAVPTAWRKQLELRDVIEEIATDLAQFPGWELNSAAAEVGSKSRLWAKYPGY